MATGVISKKYLIDIANAIRIMLDTETTYTPSQMASAIALITGNASGGELVKSSNTDVGLITDTLMDGICDSLRTALDSEDTYTPSQIADAIMTISSGSVDIVPWSTGTDEQIVAMLQAAHAGTIDLQQDGGWAVNDVRTITIGAFTDGAGVSHAQQSVDIAISSFDEYMSCGNVMQFDFKNCLLANTKMNTTATNAGGYKSSVMYTDTLPALVNALPTWLKNSLVEFSCLAYSGREDTYPIETVTGNKLALRSRKEVFGSGSDGSGKILYYAYISNLKKTRGSSRAAWWLRTPYSDDVRFREVSVDGGDDYCTASVADSLSPFGCL